MIDDQSFIPYRRRYEGFSFRGFSSEEKQEKKRIPLPFRIPSRSPLPPPSCSLEGGGESRATIRTFLAECFPRLDDCVARVNKNTENSWKKEEEEEMGADSISGVPGSREEYSGGEGHSWTRSRERERGGAGGPE